MNTTVYPLTIACLMGLDMDGTGTGEGEVFTALDADAMRIFLETTLEEKYVSVTLSALESGFPVRFNQSHILLPYCPSYCEVTFS